MNLRAARRIVGSLSFPSKMPGTSFSLPAQACITGGKLAQIAGTACAQCYALKDRWLWPNPQKAMQRRLEGIRHPQWAEAIALMLNRLHAKGRIRVDLGNTGVRLQKLGGSRFRYNEAGYHRWHDSGDLQSVEHFAKICAVARATPAIKHWLPTQELGMVRAYLARGGKIPHNLVVRVSSIIIDDTTRRNWPLTSSVASGAASGYVCPAPDQAHRCMTCRACWDRAVPHLTYRLH